MGEWEREEEEGTMAGGWELKASKEQWFMLKEAILPFTPWKGAMFRADIPVWPLLSLCVNRGLGCSEGGESEKPKLVPLS